jgi:aminomethyltransferase
MGQRTSLYSAHLQAGAKMVDFAGWDMPIHYGSQLNEHQSVRKSAGIFDVSHMTVIDLQGKDVTQFLQLVLANDVAKLKAPGKALYSCLLNEDGGIIDDLIVYYLAKDHYRIVSNSSTRDTVCAWLTLQLARFNTTLDLRGDLSILAIQGPQAITKLKSVLSFADHAVLEKLKPFHTLADGDLFIARTGYTGEDGVEIMLPNEKAEQLWKKCLQAGIAPCGLGARDTLRLESGLNLYGTDMTIDTTPLESNLAWTVALEPPERHFIGRSALIEQMQHSYPQLVGLVLETKGVLRNHLPVWIGEQRGEITSGSYSPSLERGIAMARIPAGYIDSCEVELRGKRVPARIIKLPFLKHGRCTFSLTAEGLTHE